MTFSQNVLHKFSGSIILVVGGSNSFSIGMSLDRNSKLSYSDNIKKSSQNMLSDLSNTLIQIYTSDAASGWAGWALSHPEFGVSVNPIPTRGQIMPTALLLAHRDLKT